MCSTRPAAPPPTPTTACATAGSRSSSAPSARSFRPRTTRATCAGSLRSTRRTPRSRPSRSASRRSQHSASTWTSMPGIRLDLDDRPQKSPRACVIASDPPNVVHLITRAQGGLHDYQAFLHEAGHALHYAGVDPELPYTFRKLSRDHALTEIYSYIVEAISREPGWHAEHFGLSDEQAHENAEATVFLEALLFRRYTAKLQFELEFWGRFSEDGGTRGRLLRAAHRRHGHSLSGRELPLRHGLRLLLGRLPPRLDPLGAAAAASRPRGGRGLVAQPRDRAIGCGSSSARARARRARRSRRGSATSRSTPRRSCTSSAPSPTCVMSLDAVRRASYLRPESGLRFGLGSCLSSHGGQGDARKALEERRDARGGDDASSQSSRAGRRRGPTAAPARPPQPRTRSGSSTRARACSPPTAPSTSRACATGSRTRPRAR